MNSPRIIVIVTAIIVAGVATITGFAVHASDNAANNHAMMMSAAAQKTALQKASTDAAMKQSESDKMAASAAMKSSEAMSTSDSMAANQ